MKQIYVSLTLNVMKDISVDELEQNIEDYPPMVVNPNVSDLYCVSTERVEIYAHKTK